MKRTPYHHYLFGIFPVLFLFSRNIGQGELHLGDVLLPLAVVLGISFVFFRVFSFWAKDRHKGAILASVFLLCFLSYGHGYTILNGFVILRHKVLLSLTGVFLVAFSYLIFRYKRNMVNATIALNIVSLFMLVPSVNSMVIGLVHSSIEERTFKDSKETEDFQSEVVSGELPDIYYLVIDSYAANTTLKEVYDYDNREFTGYLEEKGFKIASKSRSNYSTTFLSLASSLNMSYVNYLKYVFGSRNDFRILYSMVSENRVKDFLKSKGYRTLHFGMWWEAGDFERKMGANPQKNKHLSSFSLALMQNSVLIVFYDYYFASIIKNVTFNTFDMVAKVPELKGPNFVFAYFYGLHPPFVFDVEGEDIKAFQAVEGIKDSEKWKKLYLNQLKFYNSKLEGLMSLILSKSRVPPVIILQSDHGTQFSACPSENFKGCIQERMRNFNAYYLPGNGGELFYDSITPVNSFRLIFKHYFGAKIDLLSDSCYYSNLAHPFLFKDVTDYDGKQSESELSP